MEQGIFAAGCFWGVQAYFDQIPGVVSTQVGYTGGHTEDPTYDAVCGHDTGHAEATLVEFDPHKVSFDTLVWHFFRLHDPTQLNRQGPDVGDQYRSAIFYTSAEQQASAEKLKTELAPSFAEPIVTEITEASTFYPAEEYHQKYAEKTGRGMCHVAYEAIT